MASRFSLGDLLNCFPSNDIAYALVRAGLNGGGSKIERLERLRSAALQSRVSAAQVLAYFSSEALRRIGTRLGVRLTIKTDLATALAGLLTEPFPPPPQKVATTVEAIRNYIQTLAGSYRNLATEADAEWFLASALSDQFTEVRTQAPVPGNFGHRIDLDIQNGRFGIEVKFAPAIIESSSEAYRLLGQAFYYDRRRYAGRLLVVIVGPPELRPHPIIAEVLDLLGALGVAGLYLEVR